MKDLTAVAKLLNEIITTTIAGPGGDPDWHHMKAAARAFIVLKTLKLPVDAEEEYRCILRNIPANSDEDFGNVWKTDFLNEAGWPPNKDKNK